MTTREFITINVADIITLVNSANLELIRRIGRRKENTIKSIYFHPTTPVQEFIHKNCEADLHHSNNELGKTGCCIGGGSACAKQKKGIPSSQIYILIYKYKRLYSKKITWEEVVIRLTFVPRCGFS